MDPETEKIIKKQMSILPEEVKRVFVDPKIDEQILEIGKNFNLDTEKVGTLQMETTLLMLGLTDPDEYPNELKDRLKIDDQILNNMVQKINTVILPEIIEKLKELYKKTENERTEEKSKFTENIKGEISVLPKEKQEVINNFGWGKIAEEIGKNHNILEDEIEVLKEEIILVLVGIENQYYLSLNLEENTNTNKNEAKKIAEEVNQKIFKPMVDKLNEVIKRDLKNKVIHWQQNLDFILSGGDYTAFIRKVESSASSASGTTMADKQNVSATFNPSKLDDLKSKFTI